MCIIMYVHTYVYVFICVCVDECMYICIILSECVYVCNGVLYDTIFIEAFPFHGYIHIIFMYNYLFMHTYSYSNRYCVHDFK